ncbi:CBS domain-containing protein [Marinithermus hydrothermalis]|uniref:Polynucleotide adenylyltransferase region n=1 Tax=Marinithermus hydrothermalis (strain DSM 14884 / JCM 11576 / T1) TaxID=869210 RepID=F2NQP0_MARHT|nr:CBS domain-containing protein [Marinithermus hydrothermalis]AEB11978.1 Polynucleotide adenylyltransferase region [Marinithermus hydrothermalis DSM 14884]
MKVIVGHENLDFDALGSMVLARHLHPGARLVLVGGLEGRIRTVVNLFEDHLGLMLAAEVPLEAVTEVIVVDTRSAGRIGPFARLVGRVPFTVYDHHPPADGDVPAAGGALRAVGATVTILCRLLEDRGFVPAPEEATLAYAGLWEDTGGFTYPGSTPEDLEAAAFLMRAGADVGLVREWVRERYGAEVHGVLRQLLASAEVLEVEGIRVVLARARQDGYVPALAPLAHTLMDLYDADAGLLLLELGEQHMVIARSRKRLDVARLLGELFGGGGHARAAFARVELDLDAVEARIKEALGHFLEHEPTLGDLMTRGVETLPAYLTVSEALAHLVERGYGGMPVVEDGRVLGVVRRRDLERAQHHGMGEAQVTGFMQPAVTLDPSVPLSEAEAALKRGAGRVLVVQDGRLVGIFTRTDLYRLYAARARDPDALVPRLLERLPEGIRRVLEVLKERFAPQDGRIYLVGGAVRDAVLGEAVGDVDLVLEGLSAAEVARALVEALGGSYGLHYAFGTAHVRLASGVEVDLAEAREEHYPYPGALPVVRPSTIQRDLARRDFTVNAMALRVHPEPLVLLDPYGGLEDLEERRLRPLSAVSFVEDPSRIVRGLRLAARLGLTFAPQAEAQLEAALTPKVIRQASKSRLRGELLLALAEPSPLRVLEQMHSKRVLERLYGLRLTPPVRQALERLEALRPAEAPEPEAYLYLLLYGARDPEGFVRTFGFPGRLLEGLAVLREPPEDPEAVRKFGGALVQAFCALYPDRAAWLARPRRTLRGRDVLALGLAPGPQVGEVLRRVAEARARGEVRGFEEELALARKLVEDYGTNRSSR